MSIEAAQVRVRSELGHLRRGHVDGMSAIAPIATELLRAGNGRKGPATDISDASGARQGAPHNERLIRKGGNASGGVQHWLLADLDEAGARSIEILD